MAFRVTGVGSPLVDYSADVDDEFLQRFVSGAKGGTVHINETEKCAICENLQSSLFRTCGGSAANTVFALANLGVEAGLIGKLSMDDDGRFFLREMERCNLDVRNIIKADGGNTGYCISLVTADAERTMRSNLGVSVDLTEDDFSSAVFAGNDWVHIEGYMAECGVFEKILHCARKAGCRIGLDLSGFELAEAKRELFSAVLNAGMVDLIFANSAEAEALTANGDDEYNIRCLADNCSFAVLKRGKCGALVSDKSGRIFDIPAQNVERVIDTTAAGDFFSAGFYFGLAHGGNGELCGRYGTLLAAEIIQCRGTALPQKRWIEVLQKLNSEVNKNGL